MKNVKVAVVDTGIDRNHNYLKDNIVGGISFESNEGYIFVSDNYDDENGHGTLCASIIKKEFENVEIFVVKALDRFGKTNIQVLEESLKYLLNIDVNIINLSLSVMESNAVQDLYEICEKLKKQGKFIVCSVANGVEFSYPAKFNNVIGVKGFILEDENSFWYNKNYDIQCIMDNNSYLRCDLNNSYKLFGKCNSQAAAKLTGKIVSVVHDNPHITFVDLNKKLEELSTRECWTNKDLEESKRYPKFKTSKTKISKEIIKGTADTIRKALNIDIEDESLYECNLFNRYIGLNNDNCFEVIKELELKFKFNLDYMDISRYDFISIYTLAELVEKNLNNRRRAL
ncbi:MAG: S8 family serine peptidase [Paraclostridium sp.]